MEPDDKAHGKSFDIDELVSGLNEMRDALVLVSNLIKDYRANMDWETQGAGLSKALEVVSRAAND